MPTGDEQLGMRSIPNSKTSSAFEFIVNYNCNNLSAVDLYSLCIGDLKFELQSDIAK